MVGSTSDQSLPCRTWPAYSIFPGVYLLRGHGCYWVVAYHFGKHLMRQTIMWELIFYFGPKQGEKIMPVPIYGTGVIHLCVCPSVFWKIMNNFWMDCPIWTKFSGLSRLVAANLEVGSTSAQSPSVMPGPAYSPFHWSLSSPWSWVLLGRVIPFWKAFDEANNNLRADFLFWTCTCRLLRCRLFRGLLFFANWPIFHKTDPPEIKYKNFLSYATFS